MANTRGFLDWKLLNRPNKYFGNKSDMQLVQQICEIFQPNCGFDDKSMKFGTQLGHATRKIFGHRAITYLFHGSCGGHFTKWRPEFISFAHKLNCINYGWCKTHSSGYIYHLLLTCYA